MSSVELTILLPCLNEAATVGTCVLKAQEFLRRAQITGEVVVADNGSTDGSQRLAAAVGARVIHVRQRGYGAAIRGGMLAAKGKYIVVGDADDSYDFSSLDPFVEKLREGYELVMGNRFDGGIRPGAMPILHRYLGNPVLSFLGRLFFKTHIGDFHCGLRAFERERMLQLALSSSGMEFASEMVVKAAVRGVRITEVPTTLSPDGRGRASHLRTWRDGWRHLRFLLMFSPRWLFLYPGLLLLFVGATLQTLLLPGIVKLGSLGLDIHTMLYAGAMSVIGIQMVWFAVLAKVHSARLGLLPEDVRIEHALRTLTLERGLAIGLVMLIAGIILSASTVRGWAASGYGPLEPREVMRTVIPSVSMMIAGVEFIVASFLLGLMRYETSDSELSMQSQYSAEFEAEPTS